MKLIDKFVDKIKKKKTSPLFFLPKLPWWKKLWYRVRGKPILPFFPVATSVFSKSFASHFIPVAPIGSPTPVPLYVDFFYKVSHTVKFWMVRDGEETFEMYSRPELIKGNTKEVIEGITYSGEGALKLRRVFYILFDRDTLNFTIEKRLMKSLDTSPLFDTRLVLLKGVFNPDKYCWTFNEYKEY